MLVCGWDTAFLNILSENVFDDLIYYSHFVPLLAVFLIGLFIFFSDKKGLINRTVFFLSLAFVFWILIDLVLWASEKPDLIMFLWSILPYPELLVYVLGFYLVYVFVFEKNVSIYITLLLACAFIPLVLFTHTGYTLDSFDFTNCDREAIEGVVITNYLYWIEVLFILAIILLAVFSRKLVEPEKRKQLSLITLGVVFFLVSFSLGNIVGSFSEDWTIGQYGLFGAPIFVALLTYVIVKYKAFDIRVFGAQVLIVALTFLALSQYFFAQNWYGLVLTSVTVVFVAIIGYILTRSIIRTRNRSHELETMTGRLAEANDKLRQLDNAKSEFISIASHQLRTPLTAIKGFVSLLLEGSYGKTDATLQDVLNKIYVSNERLIRLVQDMLNVSRLESGRMEFKIAPVQIGEMLRDVYSSFLIIAKNKGVKFEIKLPTKDLPLVMADLEKLREVVSNLLDNAMKYTNEGEILLEAQVASFGRVVRVSVADTGIGIPADELPYLFNKFSRGKDINRLHASGTGLGLYVGKQMMEAMGGRIYAESKGVGTGSVFVLELVTSE